MHDGNLARLLSEFRRAWVCILYSPGGNLPCVQRETPNNRRRLHVGGSIHIGDFARTRTNDRNAAFIRLPL